MVMDDIMASAVGKTAFSAQVGAVKQADQNMGQVLNQIQSAPEQEDGAKEVYQAAGIGGNIDVKA
ncbi:MAG: hypothetical protein PHQ23_16575 [Candidatus Wallbacteria bacterium]|nr:hypothetical protein [Candidatus Wallbacteria bacterium]